MEELGARGSQDLMGKGLLFRRGSCCGECVFLKTKVSMKKIYPRASQIIVRRDFLLLLGFCSGVNWGKDWLGHPWMAEEWINSFSCFLGQTPRCRGVLGQQQQQLWCSSQIPGVDPRVLPRTGIVHVPWSHCVFSCAKQCPDIIVPFCHLRSFGRCIFLFFPVLYILLNII